jgi:nucleoside-diphosphate-sugar epimerase
MQVLVIGGTGFIGPYVVRELHERGHDVTLYHRGQHEPELLPQVRHFRSPEAGMPVMNFPQDLLRSEFELVIHMVAMGEADARAAVQCFAGRTERFVVLSSLIGVEPGPPERGLLTEDSPVREALYPYRAQAKSPNELNYFYDKILVERGVLGQATLPATVLRLPKVYGPGGNANLATIYGFRDQPGWRWTHGYVENVAAAIVLAAVHPAAANRIYNVGEAYTPTIGERLKSLPPSTMVQVDAKEYDFRNDINFDTSRIRMELGYAEPISYAEGLRRTLQLIN